jgi:hypothetical protein
MNYVTFNQDYSYLAVGMYIRCCSPPVALGVLTENWARDIEGIPYLHDRSICQEL